MSIYVEKRQDALLLPPTAQEQNLMPSAWTFDQPAISTVCIHHIFQAQALQTPDATALVCGQQSLTYSELNHRTNQLAHVLQRLGVGPDVCVAVCMERSFDLIVALLGILKAGGVYVPLDPAYPQERLQYMLADAQAPVILTHEGLRGQLPTSDTGQVIALDSSWGAIEQEPQYAPVCKAGLDDLAYMIYTSGSTGKPKGVAVPHRGLSNVAAAAIETFHVGPTSRVLQFVSMSFDVALKEVVMALCSGASLHLASRDALLPGPDLVYLLRAQAITHLVIPSSSLAALPEAELPALETVVVGGDACSAALVARWAPGRRFFNAYGPTETTIWATTASCVADGTQPHIGWTIPQTQCYILDQRSELVAAGEAGELYIGGIGVARGYRNRPDLTAEKFVPNPFSAEPGARLYRTGDLVRMLPDGAFDFLGRIDQQVKLRGLRIELGEIETVLMQHPAVRDALVLARHDLPGDARLVAYVVREQAAEALSALELRSLVQRHLPEYMVPSAVLVLDALPLTPNGKVDRAALPLPDASHAVQAPFVAPRTATEEVLTLIWAELLDLGKVGIYDNFFTLGGHSLLAGQVLARLRDAFDGSISVRVVFDHPTVAELATAICTIVGGDTVADTLAQLYRARQSFGRALPGEALLPPAQLPADRPVSGQLPLALAQRLWLVDQFDRGNLSYLVPLVVRLHGPLDLAALEQSCNTIVQRHEALRTVFRLVDDHAVQVILGEMRIPLSIVDLEDLDADEQALGVERLSMLEKQRPFDLAAGPLLRTTILRLSSDAHVLLLTMHHIIVDDWSLAIFWRELSALYNAQVMGRPPRLRELTVQYPDAALWQQQWLQGAVAVQQTRYWQEQLDGCATVLHLPTDRPRPAIQTFTGARETIMLPAALSNAVADLSYRAGATPFMTLLAAFQVLLHRYSGQDDFVVGSPIANRRCSEFEDLIGFFVNTLALRADLSGNPSFHEVVRRVRETALGAYTHQDLPFEQVVELVQPERDPSRNPLVQVVFALQNSPHQDIILEGVTAELVPHSSLTATFDLFLEVIPVEDGLSTACEYNTDLYDATTITRLLGHFQLLVEELVAQPEARVSDLPFLSAAECQEFRVWNATEAAYPSTRCVHDLVAERAARTPAAIALVAGSSHLSYQDLDLRANQLAHLLRERGVGPEVSVGLCLDRSIDLVVAQLAVLKAGGAFLPLDPAAPADRSAFILEDAQVALLLTTEATSPDHLPADLPVLWLDRDADLVDAAPSTPQGHAVTPANLAYLIYTSGSTGRPKGVAVPHAGLVNLVRWHQQRYSLRSSDRATLVASPAFDASVWELWPYLASGACLVIPDAATRATPAALATWLCNEGITLSFLPTALAEAVLAQPWPATTNLRALLVGGDQLHPIAEQLPFPVENHYGPTETTVVATAQTVTPGSEEGLPPIGCPIANTEVYLLDRRGHLVPIGVAGELYIGGIGVARGYHQRPDLTAEKFVPNPFSSQPGARLYRTGDLARYRADGSIEFLGRIDQQVKLRGLRIELGEIEAVISEHPAVQETVALVREDVPGNKQIVAYLVPNAHYADTGALLAESETEYIADWQQLYDDTYGQTSAETEATFNITGWNSSYTGLPMAAEEMQEQVDQVVARVLAHQPKRVLEIGIGTGLLLFRIAPHCTAYWGTDFSSTAIQAVGDEVERQGLSQVRLVQRLADDLTGIDTEPFDLVLINSVIQYFPHADYLHTVVRQAMQYVRPGGCMLLGDLRSYPLLEAYHTSIQVYQAAPTLSTADLTQRITSRVAGEEELVVDPAFFHTMQQQEARISQVEVQLRRGQYDNELTKFRYDVLLHIEREVSQVVAPQLDWQRDELSLAHLRQLLTQDAPEVALVRSVPNARVWQDVTAIRLLAGEDRPATAGALRQAIHAAATAAVDPEALWALGAELGYLTEVGWDESEIGMLQVAFRRTALCYGEAEGAARRTKPLQACTNTPTYSKLKRKLVPQVRAFMAEKLPDYMVPSAFVVLDTLPLTSNGKIDRKALPAPSGIRHDDQRTYVAPRTPIEAHMSMLWAELFSVERISIHDDFFALGGHSLLAIRLTAHIKTTFGIDLPLRDLFNAPTIAGCTEALERVMEPNADAARSAVIDLIADTALDLAIQPAANDDWFTAQPTALFLTGATGFLGAFLLHELLRTTTAQVHCLVRAKTTAAGMDRLRGTLEQYGVWDAAFASRIVPVVGDLSLPRLGLSEDAFASLATTVEGVYHSGAVINFLYPYAALRAANVLGTQEVIRLACQGKCKPLHYISTVGVASTAQAGPDGRVHEDATLGPIDCVDSGYVQSKWVAEHLVLTAKDRGLPVSIYRPSRIMGHSVTGASNLDDFMMRLIVGAVQLGSAPEIAKDENLAPVDYMAGAIVHLSLQQETVGQIFHVINPVATRFNEVAQAIKEVGVAVKVVSFGQWYQQLFETTTSDQGNVLYPLLSFLAQMPTEEAWVNLLTMPDFACENTLKGLSNSAIACPTFGAQHIHATLSYFVQRGIIAYSGQARMAEIG